MTTTATKPHAIIDDSFFDVHELVTKYDVCQVLKVERIPESAEAEDFIWDRGPYVVDLTQCYKEANGGGFDLPASRSSNCIEVGGVIPKDIRITLKLIRFEFVGWETPKALATYQLEEVEWA